MILYISSNNFSIQFCTFFTASTPCGMSGSSSRDNGYGHSSSKRKQSSQSTPSSPTRLRKAQCTCVATDPSMQQLQQQQLQGQNGRGNLKGILNNIHQPAVTIFCKLYLKCSHTNDTISI